MGEEQLWNKFNVLSTCLQGYLIWTTFLKLYKLICHCKQLPISVNIHRIVVQYCLQLPYVYIYNYTHS